MVIYFKIMREMRHYMKLPVFILTLGYSLTATAQQEPLFSHYNDIIEVFNPAVSGIYEQTRFTALNRTQWSAIDNAPETFVFGVSLPTKSNVGLGINVIQDKTFIERSTFVGVDYSYKLKLDEDTNLYLGLKGGLHTYEVDPSLLESYNLTPDTSLERFSKTLPNVGMGLYLTHKRLSISMASPRLLNTERVQEREGRAVFAKDRVHYYTSANYIFDVTQDITFDPTVITRFVWGAPMSFDFQGRFTYDKMVSLTGALRTDDTYVAMVQFKVFNNFTIGWAYESGSQSTLSNYGSSQEFMLRISL